MKSKMNYLLYVKDDSGVALITALVILVLLTALGTYAINMTEIEEMLAGNLKVSKQAFYLAESGIEWGRQQIAVSTLLPPIPADATRSLNAGSYAIRFRNPSSVGAALEYTVRVEADGNMGPASKTLHALVTKTYDLSDAAIAMRGKEVHSNFNNGDTFLIDGRDYDLNGNLTALPPQFGITVAPASTAPAAARKSIIEAALSAQQRDNIKGVDGTATASSIGESSSLPSSVISTLADSLCTSSNAASYTTINANTTLTGNQTYGSNTTPQITCFDGKGTPGETGIKFIDNVSGAGILIVKHGDLVFEKGVTFNGLIIVTGNEVGFGIMGGGTGKKEIFGSVLINETSTDGSTYKELWLDGNASLKRSQAALAMARQLIPTATLTSTIMQGLPSSTQQVSWMEINN